MSSLLSRLFPMPRLLTMQGGGIEISDRSVKYMRFVGHGYHSARLVSFGEISLPPKAVTEGIIADADAVIHVLKRVRMQCKFSLVYASLPESKGYLFSDQLPRAAASDLSDALALALSSHVPLAPAEAVYDCEVIEHESTADHVSIIAAATTEELGLSYAQVLSAAGFLPLSFELEPQAAAHAMLPHEQGPSAHATIIADLGETKTMLCVVEDGVARFTTSSEGSESLDASLMGAGDVNEIVRRKTDIGVAHGTHADAKVMLQLADRFATEISRLAVYWNAHGATQGGRAAVGNVILYGGNANIKGLPEYLTRKVGLPVTTARIWDALDGSHQIPPIAQDQSMRFATVSGLALRALKHSPFS